VTRTFFFDVSDIMAYVRTETSISGIQRVSLSVIDRMVERFGADRVKIAFWSEAGRYECFDGDLVSGQAEAFDASYLGHLFYGPRTRPSKMIAPTLERYRTRPFKYRVYHWVRHLQAALGNEHHFAKKGSSIAAWHSFHEARRIAAEAPAPPPRPTPIPVAEIAQPGDRIIVMGAIWGMEKLAAEFERLADMGVEITTLVHDLIPILAPEHMNGGYSHGFDRWLRGSASYCKSYFANSRYTAKDLAEYLEKQGTPHPIQVVPLAQCFERPVTDCTKAFRDQVQQTLQSPFVLVVGTMETRKNLLRLAQAWKLLQDRGLEMPRLVLAGKENWHKPDFKNWIAETGSLDGLIEIIDRPSNQELTALYEGCLFTAMVSTFEGWGLPIGESLSMGKTAVVANTSSTPEVGLDLVEYCDPFDVESIAAATERLITDAEHRAELERRIAAADLRTWDDVAADFVRHLEQEEPTEAEPKRASAAR
jgi:glycosyltransferase involved in cell wall biosynthesis